MKKHKGKTFNESMSRKSFANPTSYMDSLDEKTSIPKDLFRKHDVAHAYVEQSPDHGMKTYEEASFGERQYIIDKINTALEERTQAVQMEDPVEIPENTKEGLLLAKNSLHSINHGRIPEEPPDGKFHCMSPMQKSLLQNLPAYSSIKRFSMPPGANPEVFKTTFLEYTFLMLKEESEKDDCHLLSFRMEPVGRFYVCFIIPKDGSEIMYYFYCCNCQ